MLSKDSLAELKRVFSLNDYEVKLWSSLLAKGVSTAGELSELSGVPRSRTYDVLEGLEKKGFVISKIGKPITFVATHPEEVAQRYKKSLKKELDQKLNQIDKHTETKTFKKILNLFEKKGGGVIEDSNISLSLKGRQNIYTKMSNIFSEAKKEILLHTNEGGLSRKNYEIIPALEKAKQKGVKVRIITPDAKTKHAKDYKELAKLKKSKDYELRFAVVDDENLFLMTKTGQGLPQHEKALLLKNNYLAKEFKKVFHNHWKK